MTIIDKKQVQRFYVTLMLFVLLGHAPMKIGRKGYPHYFNNLITSVGKTRLSIRDQDPYVDGDFPAAPCSYERRT